jgi:Ca-activated chloride channel homolog
MCLARIALSLAMLSPELRPTEQVPVFRGGVDLVQMGVTVADRKTNLIADLTADDFEVLEDGKPQTVQYFARGDDTTSTLELHLGLLLDVSESMADTIGFTRTASIRFLNTLADAVDVTLVDFDTQVRVARYGRTDFVRLIERIRTQKVRGFTALYDAIGVYLDGAAGQNGRKVMLLYTDGGDTKSALRLNELMDLLKASDVTVYAIGAFEQPASSERLRLEMVLRQITEATGGMAFFPSDVRALDKVYAQVVAEIRAQYTLGYLSTNPRTDGAWRKVEIRLRAPQDRRIRSRKGYYAPLRP